MAEGMGVIVRRVVMVVISGRVANAPRTSLPRQRVMELWVLTFEPRFNGWRGPIDPRVSPCLSHCHRFPSPSEDGPSGRSQFADDFPPCHSLSG